MKKLIAFIGPQGSGKTTLALEYIKSNDKAHKLSFADPIRSMIAAFAGYKDPQVLKHIDKSVELPSLNSNTYRHAAQTLGTEWGRHCMGEDVWLNKFYEAAILLPEDAVIVIDDARFSNEFDFIRENFDSIFFRVFRDADKNTVTQSNGHSSEADWSDQDADYSVENNWDISYSLNFVNGVLRNVWN